MPNLADAPRYARHKFQQHRSTLAALADGYLDGYAQGRAAIRHSLHQEYFLWALDVAYECLQRLKAGMTLELYLRAGDKAQIAARLQRCLAELEALAP